MLDRRGFQEFFCEIADRDFQAGGVDAGMAADGLCLKDLSVDQDVQILCRFIAEAQDTGGARFRVENGFHFFGAGEGKPFFSNLCGDCFQIGFFFRRKQEQVPGGAG